MFVAANCDGPEVPALEGRLSRILTAANGLSEWPLFFRRLGTGWEEMKLVQLVKIRMECLIPESDLH